MNKQTILIIEKSKVIQAYVSECLKPLGVVTKTALTGSEVRDVCKTGPIGAALLASDFGEEAEEILDYLLREKTAVIVLGGVEPESTRKRLENKNIVSTYDKHEKAEYNDLVRGVERILRNRLQKVLVVDDSKTFRHYVVRLLRSHGFEVFEAESGADALSIVRHNEGMDLVLTDYEMPEMNGMEVIQGIRRHHSQYDLPIIVISSLDAKEVVVDCLREGANDYLHKPFGKEELFSRLYQVLGYKENLKELEGQTELLKHYQQTIDKNTIVSMSDESGMITYISEAYEKVSGYTNVEVIGRKHGIFRHPDTPKEFYRQMWELLMRQGSWDGEVRNLRKDGTSYWLKLHIEQERDPKGKLTGFSAIGHDITDKINLEILTRELESRVRAEVEKNRLQTAQMLEQSRLAQMGEMISMIAHQWRQPLASISAIASTLEIDVMMDSYEKDFFEERLRSIAELAQHLSSTIDDFRNFFKAEKKKEETTPGRLIEGALQIIEVTLKNAGIEVEKGYESQTPVETYPNELKQVILNILKNAEDVLMLSASKEKIIRIRCYESRNSSFIEICDNGGGIPEEVVGKIFDPYFSTKKQKDGTGLGLYMSKTIVEEHCGGRLEACNKNGGACFVISIPLICSQEVV